MSEVITPENSPFVIKEGQVHHTSLSLQAHPNGGAVTIEIYDPVADDFYLPDDPLHTMTERAERSMERVGKPSVRINVSGASAYAVLHGVIWA